MLLINEEKVYLHIDRDVYNLGEEAFYKAYVLDAYSLQPQVLSRVLYVDLLDYEQNLIDHQILRIEDGVAFGKFILDNKLSRGDYFIRSYTNWMRNWAPESSFIKRIHINSPFSAEENESLNSIGVETAGLEVSMIPEGGPLLHKTLSKVSIHIQDEGIPVKINELELLDEKDQVIQSLSQEFTGRAILNFIPDSSSQYSIKFSYLGQERVYPMPPIQSTGAVISILGESNDNIFFKLANADQSPVKVTLKIEKSGFIFANNSFLLRTEKLLAAAKKDIPYGVCQVILSDSTGNYISTLNFVNKAPVLDVSIQLRKSDIGETIIDINGIDSANMSLALIDMNQSPIDTLGKSIETELLLESELDKDIETPQLFLDNGMLDTDLRVLLAKTKNNDFTRWKKPSLIEFLPEGGLLVKGTVKRKKKKELTLVNLIYPDNRLQSNVINDDGSFEFLVDDYSGSGIFTIHSSNKRAKVIVENVENVDNRYFPITKRKIPLKRHGEELNFEWDEDVLILDEITVETQALTREAFMKGKRGPAPEPLVTVDVLEVFEKSSYPDLLSLLSGRIPGFRVININAQDSTQLEQTIVSTRGANNFLTPAEVQFFLDGILIDRTILIDLDPNIIDFIDLYKPPITNFFGAGFNTGNGVVAIYTKKGEGNNILPPDNILKFNLEGYTEYYPNHSERDFESSGATIYWNPVITSKETIKIPRLSSESRYRLVLEGVNNQGQLIHHSLNISSENIQ